ncbi:DUF202 domain-containing protein [Streptomyces sp. 549]|uniref:DUF202 domain-containing protein n=1 Tax=Streptomyces sp. 549 TaxID=3049076 RepID=UPI0024C2B8C3|nr:DUF202 domain-containing protein [Streptomyces sp. 549]MDK1475710.1 DUF202 domain-containing protein [Streptomyces sp. 549]
MSAGRDPGVQPERTRLAWRRTTLAASVAVLLFVRQALVSGSGPEGWLAIAAAGVVWAALLLTAHRRLRGLATARPAPVAPGTVWLVTGGTLALAALGFVLLR